jgi:transcriptional regulator with XRE-family HTH domain
MKSRMKEIRESKGMGQKEVAAKLLMPVRRYGSYERGERTISLNDAAQIADVLEVSIDELMGREQKPSIDYSFIDMNNSSFKTNEEELVDIYRSLSVQGKEHLLVYARGCAASYK